MTPARICLCQMLPRDPCSLCLPIPSPDNMVFSHCHPYSTMKGITALVSQCGYPLSRMIWHHFIKYTGKDLHLTWKILNLRQDSIAYYPLVSSFNPSTTFSLIAIRFLISSLHQLPNAVSVYLFRHSIYTRQHKKYFLIKTSCIC